MLFKILCLNILKTIITPYTSNIILFVFGQATETIMLDINEELEGRPKSKHIKLQAKTRTKMLINYQR